jgi:hypothetical protein
MYFVIGNDVHLIYDKEKIISPEVVISKLLNISDRSYVEIDRFIKDCNTIAKTKR